MKNNISCILVFIFFTASLCSCAHQAKIDTKFNNMTYPMDVQRKIMNGGEKVRPVVMPKAEITTTENEIQPSSLSSKEDTAQKTEAVDTKKRPDFTKKTKIFSETRLSEIESQLANHEKRISANSYSVERLKIDMALIKKYQYNISSAISERMLQTGQETNSFIVPGFAEYRGTIAGLKNYKPKMTEDMKFRTAAIITEILAMSNKKNQKFSLNITGHTNIKGSKKLNEILSEKRAHIGEVFISAYFKNIKQEISITAKGGGETSAMLSDEYCRSFQINVIWK